MNKKMFGLLNLHYSPELGPLTKERPVATLSFLGRYALMDFALSNFVNSGIDQIGILVRDNLRSVNKHLGSRNTFNINTKIGFQTVMFNERQQGGNKRYNHDFANLKNNAYVLDRTKAEYIVFAPAHFLFTLDYRAVLAEHIKNHAEITLVYANVNNAKKHFIGSTIVSTSEDGRVIGLKENKGSRNKAKVSLEVFIINRQKLLKIIDQAAEISSFFGLHDYIAYSCNSSERVHAYEYQGFLRCFDSGEHYMNYSLEFLNYHHRQLLFKPEWPIYTVTHDTPPTRYDEEAEVHNSFVANGAYIAGKVTNSIISRGVEIEAGAEIDNCILFSGTKVAPGVSLKNVIVDKRARVSKISHLIGTEEDPIYISQGDEV